MKIDINCDLGEEAGNDAAIMPYISSANIACGYHAGSEQTMLETIHLARAHNVTIGAHPGYHDRANFGRIEQHLSTEAIIDLIQKQILLLKSKVDQLGSKLHHVKPHGALYNQAARDPAIAGSIARAIHRTDPQLTYVGLANSCMEAAAAKQGLRFRSEAFSDRAYTKEGQLASRSQPGAVLSDPLCCCERAYKMVIQEPIESIDGTPISIKADSICVHGDQLHALTIAKAIHHYLITRQVTITAQ